MYLASCARQMYALKVLSAHGQPSTSLQDVYQATVMAKLLYCLSHVPARNMSCMLMKFNSEVLKSQMKASQMLTLTVTYPPQPGLVKARVNFVPNRVLAATPLDISPLESLLPRSVSSILAELSKCQSAYKARITSGTSE